MAQEKMPLAKYIHTSVLFSLAYLTPPSVFCPWVGRCFQCSSGPAWPLQALPGFPPSTGRDVTGPTSRDASVFPLPGSRVWGSEEEEVRSPFSPRRPTQVCPRPDASTWLFCCEPVIHKGPEGKASKTLENLLESLMISNGYSPVDPCFQKLLKDFVLL